MFEDKYRGATVVVTGHTGFKGAWLTAWLKTIGANVVGIALDPPTDPSHYEAANLSTGIIDWRIDIRQLDAISEALLEAQPDFVFHLAAQSLVKRSYSEPIETWQTNVMGTINLLESLRNLNKKCAAVLITSDKCYENVEWVWGYREIDNIGGIDPYSASKGAAELAIQSYVNSYFPKETSMVRVASARAGNVIGGGDWSKDRIIADCAKAWFKQESVELRNPHSTRPWQHVMEPLSGYLRLGTMLLEDPNLHGEPFNFGPRAEQNYSVLELVKAMSAYWDAVRWVSHTNDERKMYESGLLKLNCDKALHYLNWHSALNFQTTVRLTAEWYMKYLRNPAGAVDVTQAQISEYLNAAKSQELAWTL